MATEDSGGVESDAIVGFVLIHKWVALIWSKYFYNVFLISVDLIRWPTAVVAPIVEDLIPINQQELCKRLNVSASSLVVLLI